jgi:glycosyltransferase involved in cell wall biosynthesis
MTPAVDARFIDHSGIGRHIHGVLEHWPSDAPRGVAAWNKHPPAGWRPFHCTARMYSIAEQCWGLRRLPQLADITWFPHYAHPWRCPGRWVCTVHDVLHLAMPGLFPGRVRRWAAHALLADVRDHAAAVCFVSRFSQSEFHRLVGIPRGTQHIVGNGVDAGWSLPTTAPAGWDGRPYVVALGNLKPHKGLTHLLRAMLDPRLADLRLVLIGRSEGLRTVDRAALDLVNALGDRCLLTGPVDDAALRGWVGSARTLAFPSLYEGFGLPPLEAMAAGVPVVASDIPAVREVCGDAALLVPAADAKALAEGLVRLHQDDSYRTATIARGRRCATQWTWDATAHATWQALAQAV